MTFSLFSKTRELTLIYSNDSFFSRPVYHPCPESHAFAYDSGIQCCSKYYPESNPAFGSLLQVDDPVEECAPDNRLTCPGLPLLKCNTTISEGK